VPALGELLYLREADAEPLLRWTPAVPLAPVTGPIRAWDGSRAGRSVAEPIEDGIALSLQCLATAQAVFVSHDRALPEAVPAHINPSAHIWVPGLSTWQALAERGLWVDGCADGLGVTQLEPLLREPLLQLPPLAQWTVLTHAGALGGWAGGQVIATYRHREAADIDEADAAPPNDVTHLYWHSSAQFERWGGRTSQSAQHACGPGKTYQHLLHARVQNLQMFPSAAQWRTWLRL